MRDLQTFFVAGGFLSAISLVWGQLWMQYGESWRLLQSDTGLGNEEIVRSAIRLGLAWTYLSVLLVLAAAIWVGLANIIKPTNKRVGRFPLAMLATAVFFTSLNVVQSVMSSFTRLYTGEPLAGYLINIFTSQGWAIATIILAIALLLLFWLLPVWAPRRWKEAP